jgi:hypothetical protein
MATKQEKPAQIIIDEKLWLEAKSKAVIEDIPFKKWLTRAIQNELNRVNNQSKTAN